MQKRRKLQTTVLMSFTLLAVVLIIVISFVVVIVTYKVKWKIAEPPHMHTQSLLQS